ncbi:glucosiduronase [Granulicella sp. WH15]|uniref:alpha-glucuronidase family glycosyl hydrolase n=1 Tax=Granulicella sp. WH15 TaxID=2602070 RepID=UPI00136720F2|nr:alpha-glucuronidase family glycosyl hydrolase [Granulicella sp. WH15]QHN03758.1 glucosiduronase [Granulicella sp. WH15]
MRSTRRILGIALVLVSGVSSIFAQSSSVVVSAASVPDSQAAWLRYQPLGEAKSLYAKLPSVLWNASSGPTSQSASEELHTGLERMLGKPFSTAATLPAHGDALVLGTSKSLAAAGITTAPVAEEGFRIERVRQKGRDLWVVTGGSERGELYGTFRLLSMIAAGTPLPQQPLIEEPANKIRWINQWDNLNGSIERGYGGRSIFFDDGHVRADLTRPAEYARLLASIGINGVTINNVNSDLRTLTPEMIEEIARVADVFRPWGVRLSLSVDLSSPQVVGKLPTFDPLDPTVAAWWQKTVDQIYTRIPDFAGFVVKADSEGRAGPSQYGRTPAEAANVLARALQPHGGLVLYRGFVYNHHLDWNDLKADRARAGYDNFHTLDGKFEPNVVIQVKHGPIDFQVREPVSPLIPALQHTPQTIELQITQEYLGQQRHMVFLVPMWKWVLDTDMRVPDPDGKARHTPVKQIVSGHSFRQPTGGFVGVANVGLEDNWMHHPMALANLYGYGRLAWNPDLTSEQIIEQWTRMSFGNDPLVVATIDRIQLESWHAYENYSGPLGIGTLTEITGVHFGPGIESAERNGWGQWFRGDSKGIGMDRTVATGTGYIGQYPPELAAKYESLTTCPDDLLLFMHHVPYTHQLHSGKTVVQHVYDSHYEGAATAASYSTEWAKLKGHVDPATYTQVADLFTYQAGHAIVWRDAVNDWFHRISGIDDTAGRVGHHSGRIEAENMTPDGYTPVDVTPWETASGGKAVACNRAETCTLTTKTTVPEGRYNIAIQYFDLHSGTSSFDLLLNGHSIATWKANATLPPDRPDVRLNGHTSTRFTTPPVALHAGDTLELRGTSEGKEPAPVDYIELTPATP